MQAVKEGEEGNTFFLVLRISPVNFSNMVVSIFAATAEGPENELFRGAKKNIARAWHDISKQLLTQTNKISSAGQIDSFRTVWYGVGAKTRHHGCSCIDYVASSMTFSNLAD